MRNLLAGIMLIPLITQCNNTKHPDNPISKDSSERTAQQAENELSNISNSSKMSDFLTLVGNSMEAGKYSLQGVTYSDSAGPYVIKQFYSDSLDFDLLFYPKNGDKKVVDFDAVRKGKSNGYKDFICFAFVYPMQNPDSMQDYHADNTTYPVLVKAYARKSTTWNFIAQSKVNSLSEMSEFKIKIIYMNIN
jgi:hypothetical protein